MTTSVMIFGIVVVTADVHDDHVDSLQQLSRQWEELYYVFQPVLDPVSMVDPTQS